jgi:hypothetical protein
MPPVDFRLGDLVRMRKAHPCGGADFEVIRLGADIGLRCDRCGRRILLARSMLERRMQSFARRSPRPDAPVDIETQPTA